MFCLANNVLKSLIVIGCPLTVAFFKKSSMSLSVLKLSFQLLFTPFVPFVKASLPSGRIVVKNTFL
jgi:hypothetical protein